MFKKIVFVLSALVILSALPSSASASTFTGVTLGSQSKTPIAGTATTSITYLVTVTRTGTGAMDVFLSAPTLPTGVSATFSAPLVFGNPAISFPASSSPAFATTTLTLSTSNSTPAGNLNFQIRGRDFPNSPLTATGTLTVLARPVIILSSSLSTSTPTNQDITVTASTTTGTLNTTSHLFTQNGSFSFVANNSGVLSTSTVTITNIDKVVPVLGTSTDILHIQATSPLGAVATYTNPSVTDNNPGSIVTCSPASGSTFVLGTTGVVCNAIDAAGNHATSTTFNVTVEDTTAPVIVLTGSNPQIVQAGTTFTDLGAVAQDASGNFAASSTNNVNTGVFGTYTVTYTATDASGNVASSTTRTVNVVDTTAPTVPTIVSPLNNAVKKTIDVTKFDWTDVTDFSSPVTYSFQLATTNATNPNGSFSFPTVTSNLLSTSEAASASSSISSDGDYYYITRAIDALGNTGSWSTPTKFTIDNTAPVITVTGSSTITIEGGSTYTELGATALDSHDGSFAATVSGTVNTSVVGTYTVTYTASDIAGNAATAVTRTVNVVDTTVPVIHVTGSNPATVEGGSTYTDAGATATDNVSAPVTVTSTSTVNTQAVGTYAVTYDAVDPAGNHATTTTRTVNVVDTTAPVIHINNANPITFTINLPYVEYGATAADIIDGAVTTTATGTVDTSTLGSYTVTYTATDVHGNTASSSRTVLVIPPDTTAPVLTILGSNPATVEGGSTYTDAGATANDNVSGNLTAHIAASSTVNTQAVGTYAVTYDVADGAGNASHGARVVNVVDTTAPTLALIGSPTVSIHTGDTYVDDGATTTDNLPAPVTISVTGGPVVTTATSTFVLTYNAVDTAGNHSIPVTRTINVIDVTVPVITMLGTSPVTVQYGDIYTDAGATASDDVDMDITSKIVTVGASVDTHVLGAHTVSYDVTDSSGNPATTITRTVNVVDTSAPVVTLNGSSTVSLTVGDEYTELGATSTDNVDAMPAVVITGSVSTSTPGTYVLTYSSTDMSGNTGSTTRTVIVSAIPDVTAPIITLIGGSTISINNGSTYTDAGATTTDDIDSNVPYVVTGSVNTNLLGTYILTFNATDTAGNVATPVTRTVTVVATPVVSNGGGATGGGSVGGGSTPVVVPSVKTITVATSTATSTQGLVLGITTFKFNKDLRLKMNNNDVLELQKRLAAEGFFTVDPTGYFGQVTLKAVKQYQTAHNIKPVSGFVGILTRAELNK